MIMREIGSEFQYQVNNVNKRVTLPQGVKDYALVFSGRTAIEVVLENEPHIRKVMLPSYCCDSMIEPFRKRRIKICFYNVNYVNGLYVDIMIPRDVDAVLWCNYFGYTVKMPNFADFVSRGGIIIEDITHSFYSIHKYDKQSKYLIASIRKWEPILCGGYCASMKAELKYIPSKLPDESFITNRKSAMLLKKEYLADESFIEKEEFLKKYAYCNEWLSKNYSERTIDEESIEILTHTDSEKNFNQRRKNAMILHESIEKSSTVKLLFDESAMDCPLFVPIVVDCHERNNIRRFLSNYKIYCPIHWPHPNEECTSNLYDMEISLICDQRYDENDMLRIADVINEFTKSK